MAVISASRFCRSRSTFLSICPISDCSCRFNSLLRMARLSACSDKRRLCACCCVISLRFSAWSMEVVAVGFDFSFLPNKPKKPLRFVFLGCSCVLFAAMKGTRLAISRFKFSCLFNTSTMLQSKFSLLSNK